MKVFRFVQDNLVWGERILLIAAPDIETAKKYLPRHVKDAIYEHELIVGLEYNGSYGEGIIEHFYWEE